MVKKKYRLFGVWKSQVALWLFNLDMDGEEFKKDKEELIKLLDKLRSRWMTPFFVKMNDFCKKWNIEMPQELLPDSEELAYWRETRKK